ncbi:hypothetical protein D3C71_1754240 [compost metagenome]
MALLAAGSAAYTDEALRATPMADTIRRGELTADGTYWRIAKNLPQGIEAVDLNVSNFD